MDTATRMGQRTETQGRRVRSGQRGKMVSGEAGAKETKQEKSVKIHRFGVMDGRGF